MWLIGAKAARAAAADKIVDLCDDAIVVVDRDHNITRFNAAAERLFAVTAGAVIGRPLDLLIPERFHLQHGLMMDGFAAGARAAMPANARGRQIYGQRGDGSEFLAAVQVMKLGGGRDALAAVVRDISQDSMTESELLHMAAVDPLTGAYNRREFTALADREAQRAARYHHPLCVMVLDIDNFRALNDGHGAAAGDRVLQALTRLCSHTLRTVDIFGRWGGEEFAALLPETPVEGAMVIAERLRRLVAETPVPHHPEDIAVTVSIGVAPFREGDLAIDGPLSRAMTALNEAKAQGRNRVAAARA